MFTGLIKEVGTIKNIKKGSSGSEIEITSKDIVKTVQIGDSIAVDGCCLTAKKRTTSSFTCDISFSTLKSTTFRFLRPNDLVNLEDSMSVASKFGGHFVSGHIDETLKIIKISKTGDSYKFCIYLKPELLPFISAKGSIAINGISLTVSDLNKTYFSTIIIPHTFNNTNLKTKKVGDFVNIEVDLISRYIANIIKYNKQLSTKYLFKESLYQEGFSSLKDGKSLVDADKNSQINDQILKEKLEKYGFIK